MVNDSQAQRGEFMAIVSGLAIRRKKIVPNDLVVRYFAANPGPLCVCLRVFVL